MTNARPSFVSTGRTFIERFSLKIFHTAIYFLFIPCRALNVFSVG